MGSKSDSGHSEEGTIYDLFAVTNHYGRLGFGHYTSFARDWAGMYATSSGDVSTECETDRDEDDDRSSSKNNKNSNSSSSSSSSNSRLCSGGKSDGDNSGNGGAVKDNNTNRSEQKDRPVGGGQDIWYSYDDDDVARVQTKDVKTRAAYILFYRKRPPNCVPSGSVCGL